MIKSVNLKSNLLSGRFCLPVLLFAFLQIFCIRASAQEGNITLKADNIPLEQVLNRIEQETRYHFLYNENVNVGVSVSIDVRNEPLKSVLDKLLKGNGIDYKVQKRQIVLTKAGRASAVSRKITVNGKVVDGDGEPLTGASVVAGDGAGVATDIDGNYSIEMQPGAQLKVTYIGFIPYMKRIDNDGTVNITMEEDRKVLDEVVVTGYGATTRKNLTTSIATVKADKIQKAAVSNVNGLLLGRAAGVQATVSSPQPGGGINISVRGGGNPVYVVDGVVMPNGSLEAGTGDISLPSSINRSGLQGLNPNDIESIEILKDASASIYGIGAADGVILITTKKGKVGKPTITYDGSYTWQKPYTTYKLLHGDELMNMVNLYSKENYLYENGQYPYGNTAYDGRWVPIFTPEQIANALDTDWRSLILKDGAINNHNISVNGGSEWVKYYLGLNYYREDATVKNSSMERYTLRTNIQTKFTDFLRLTTIANLNHNNYSNSTLGGDVGNQRDACAGALFAAENYPSYLDVTDENGNFTKFNRIPNPVSSLLILDRSQQRSFYVNFALDVDIIRNMLTLRGVYGNNYETSKRDSYIPSNVYFSLQTKSRGNIESSDRSNTTLEGFINFNHKFGDIVNLSAMLGMGLYKYSLEGKYISYENSLDQLNSQSVQKADGPFFPGSYKSGDEKRSQFGRITGDFLDRYVVSASLRRDGTDKFFPGKKYSWFPSVSLAWKMHNEGFIRDITWINMLKLRASYGETGSDNLGSSLYGVIGTTRENVMFANNSVAYIPFVIQGADYPDVTWQKTTMKNVGLDFSILNDRLSGAVDYFRNDVTHLLGYAPTEILGMHGTRPINGAHYKREGIDISLNSTNINTRDFTWTSMLTLSHYKATWLKRMPNEDFAEYRMREGEPMNAMYYYKTDGLININRDNIPESQRSLGGNACQPGFPIIVDKNGDGVIDVNDSYMEDMLPKLYYGFGNTFTYKGFDLEIFVYGQLWSRKNNPSYQRGIYPSGDFETHNMTRDVYHVWNSQTNNANAKFPGIAIQKTTLPGNLGVESAVENASYLRMRNITLGYNLQPRTLSVFNGYIKAVRVYVDFQNPFTITRFKDADPEIQNSVANLVGGQYPNNRAYSVGVKLQF